MIIYGASGHAKVIIDIIQTLKEESIDFILDDDKSIQRILGFDVHSVITVEMTGLKSVIAVGNNITRKRIAERLSFDLCNPLIHKSAILSKNLKIGNGTVVMANTTINSSTVIGSNCIINTGAIVEHDILLGDFVHISPGAVITGNVQIGEGTHVGAGATVIPGVNIGKWATIGAGAVVINDIPDFAVVVGTPGKVIKYNK
jgi:sugar O-acyltransferase (sialic acid O-acetyltransferase NeuD family)